MLFHSFVGVSFNFLIGLMEICFEETIVLACFNVSLAQNYKLGNSNFTPTYFLQGGGYV